MAATGKATMISAALAAAIWVPTDVSAQSNLRERVGAAVEAVEGACAADISRFCGNVTRGEGRVLQCMQAYDDQLSRRCQFALFRASRNLERALDRVERIADACWTDIEAQCGDVDRIGQCIMQKADSLSASCKTVVGSIKQALQGLASLRGMPVLGSDGTDLGQVVEVVRGPDGKVQSLTVEVGRFLGVGGRTVKIDANAIEQMADRIKLRISGEAVRSMPEATSPAPGAVTPAPGATQPGGGTQQ